MNQEIIGLKEKLRKKGSDASDLQPEEKVNENNHKDIANEGIQR